MKRHSPSALGMLASLALAACGGTQSHATDTGTDATVTDAADAAPPEQMSIARAAGKASVPVDVRYQLDGTPVRDQPLTLQLALIPRVTGQNLRVEFPPSRSVVIESGGTSFARQKADAAGVYRHTLLVTPRDAAGGEVRVLVSMDVEGGRYFGIFSIPLNQAPAAAKPAEKRR